MTIQIDKGIPLAPSQPGKGGGRKTIYPWRQMEVGDSFFVPDRTIRSFSGSAAQHRPRRFSMRTVVENGVSGIRIWRVK